MGRKITFKLILVYVATVLIMFLLLNAVGMRMVKKKLLERKQVSMVEEAKSIATDFGENYYHSAITLRDLRKQLISIDSFLDIRVLLTNASGTVYLDTRGRENETFVIEQSFLNEEIHNDIIFNQVSDVPVLMVCEPILADFYVRGYVCLVVSMESVSNEALFFIDTINLFVLMFAVILLLVSVYIYFITVWPVAVLKKIAVEYARKNYTYSSKHKLHDEYRDISEAMRVTAEEVDRLVDYQKKFVGNVSHDFRSPLTSIKGYIAAIKDGTIPLEMADRYLDIILFETERLTKLTEDLLNLSRMDNEVELDISIFDINQMIKKTAASFEGTCTKKRISFELEFCEKEVLVSADFSRIQQVLYNLIDNAIKFSNSDSSIVLSVSMKLSKVMISVKDFGIGIPKDAQKKVFERFYKTDLSRGKDKRGTGLGLAIVKEIVEAHGENITVVSTEGVGTEFIFSLPAAEM